MPSSIPVIRFEPVYQTRVWGGRTLESQFGRTLPDPSVPFGESWEISARDEADTAVASPETLRGKRLTELWEDAQWRDSIFGPSAPDSPRFPLLCKILDAREKLSIQVHPPQAVADKLGGEAKTEVWYIAEADEGAEIYVGVKKGVTSESFREALSAGTVADLVHVIRPRPEDFILIESGRLHAIGSGLVIYEIQQNSDTTYRVFDWNRLGLDGKPRDLHVEESLQCIDFDDVEPTLDSSETEVICDCEHFRLEQHSLSSDDDFLSAVAGRFAIITVVSGSLGLPDGTQATEGDFFVIPYQTELSGFELGDRSTKILLSTWPENKA